MIGRLGLDLQCKKLSKNEARQTPGRLYSPTFKFNRRVKQEGAVRITNM